jgi:hypothetical protein
VDKLDKESSKTHQVETSMRSFTAQPNCKSAMQLLLLQPLGAKVRTNPYGSQPASQPMYDG